MEESELKGKVLATFSALNHALNTLSERILKDNTLFAWLDGLATDEHLAARKAIVETLTQLEYTPDQAPREILVVAGLIAASPATLAATHQVNDAKRAFKEAMLQLKAKKIPLRSDHFNEAFEKLLPKRNSKTAATLKRYGLSRLHLKQCYRTIPILETAPDKISWTWANTRAITKISLEEAENRLKKLGDDAGIQTQLQQLSYLPKTESLAIVQSLAPHLRANIVFHAGTEKEVRTMIKGPVPIFYPATANTPIPKFKAPKLKPQEGRTRAIRSDVKLSPVPFLPAIHAHRYEHE